MQGWAIVALGDHCEFRRGLTYKKSDEVEESRNAVLRANNIDIESGELNLDDIRFIRDEVNIPESKKVRCNSLLVCTASGSKKHLGKIALVEDELGFAFGGFMGLLVPLRTLLPKYLFWLTRSDLYSDFIHGLASGTNINNLKWSQLSQLPIPLPPVPAQKRIVATLDEAFAATATATANAEKNLANARELFESRLNAVFDEGNEQWRAAKLGDLCNFVRGPFGGSLRKSCFVETGFAVYEQQHAIKDQFDQIRYFIDERKFSEMSRFELRPGDLIMSCSGTMGRVAIAPQDLQKGIINQALLKLTPSSDLLAKYLKLWMQSENFQKQLSIQANGVAIKNVASVKLLKEIVAPLPTIENQLTVIEELKDLQTKTDNLHRLSARKLTLLSELKQSILHKAFAGELTANPKAVDRALSEARV